MNEFLTLYGLFGLRSDKITIFASFRTFGDNPGISVVGGAALIFVHSDPVPRAIVTATAHVTHRDTPVRRTVSWITVVES